MNRAIAEPAAGNRQRWIFAAVALAGLLAAAFLRWHDLGHAAMRSDEINFFFGASRQASLAELWKNPPWLEQIPLADSLPIAWTRLTGAEASEATVRQPFALLGFGTVLFCVGWLWRRKRWAAAALCAVWLGLLPFHVYHSREAYYYVLTMFLSAGMFLRGADLLVFLKRNQACPPPWRYAEWALWTAMAGLGHMTAWPCAAGLWVLLAASGWKRLAKTERKRHVVSMLGATLFLAIWMSRWVVRAAMKVLGDFSGDKPLIGGAFSWLAPRILPFFAGGANAVGVGLLVSLALMAGLLVWRLRKRNEAGDDVHAALSWVAGIGLLLSTLYVLAIGKGTAKLVYFSCPVPVLLTWAALTVDRFWAEFGPKARQWGMLASAIAVGGLLIWPAYEVTQLDGKPAAYRLIRAWLDSNLEPGDVAIVDRWYEPWNEMALYAPTNAFVNFTVPDEPYEQYVGLNWRQTTKDLFERNGAQAFIRLQRNHEKRIGLWTWPETWFKRRVVVANEAGRWLRDTGFAPMEEYYSDSNRVQTEIFYDTHADVAARAQAAGQDVVWFFGAGWTLFKPWQQGDFADYRVLEREAAMTVHNLRGEPLRLRGEIVAAAMGADQTVRLGDLPPLAFPAGRLERRTFELELPPGVQPLRWKNLGSGGALLVRDFRLARAE